MEEMFFVHNYAGSKDTLRIIYIEYHGRRVHEVVAENDGYCVHFDFEYDCKGYEKFMYYNSGSGGSMNELQGTHIAKGYTGASYWIHPDAKFGKHKPRNIKKREKPMRFNGEPNPFNRGREIYGQDYCKFCKRYYDEDACPEHHVVVDGELQYFDGSKID